MEYIPSRRVLNEGGYEAEIFSAHLAGATWAPSVEDLIVSNPPNDPATAGTEIDVIEHRVSDQSGKDISGPAHRAVHIGGGKSQSYVTEDLKLGSGFHITRYDPAQAPLGPVSCGHRPTSPLEGHHRDGISPNRPVPH